MTAALIDLLLVALGYCATFFIARTIGAPGPGAIAVVVALAVATWRLNAHGASWPGVGFRVPDSWWKTLGWVVLSYVAVAMLVALVVAPLARALGWPPTDLSRFASLRGNAAMLAAFLLLAWTTAAFGEELLFRGFALTRFEALLGGTRGALVAAVLLQAALFAAGHAYLGVRGAVTAGVVGLVYGVVYAVDGRQLVPLVIAHGLTDSISLIALHAGVRAG